MLGWWTQPTLSRYYKALFFDALRHYLRCNSLGEMLKRLLLFFSQCILLWHFGNININLPQIPVSLEIWNIFLETVFQRIRLTASLWGTLKSCKEDEGLSLTCQVSQKDEKLRHQNGERVGTWRDEQVQSTIF